jgi:hypothetical protein
MITPSAPHTHSLLREGFAEYVETLRHEATKYIQVAATAILAGIVVALAVGGLAKVREVISSASWDTIGVTLFGTLLAFAAPSVLFERKSRFGFSLRTRWVIAGIAVFVLCFAMIPMGLLNYVPVSAPTAHSVIAHSQSPISAPIHIIHQPSEPSPSFGSDLVIDLRAGALVPRHLRGDIDDRAKWLIAHPDALATIEIQGPGIVGSDVIYSYDDVLFMRFSGAPMGSMELADILISRGVATRQIAFAFPRSNEDVGLGSTGVHILVKIDGSAPTVAKILKDLAIGDAIYQSPRYQWRHRPR